MALTRKVTVRFWGTRGTMPVAATARDVRAKIIDALVAAHGQHIDSRQEAAAFVDRHLSFAESATYGGATSCVEIDCSDEAFFICDMGSGLQAMGVDAMGRSGRKKKYNFFLSSLHSDHLMGFSAFLPARDDDAEIVIHSCHADAEDVLRRLPDEALCSRSFDSWDAGIRFVTLEPGAKTMIDGILVDTIAQDHPGGSFGYRFTNHSGRTIVYSTDSEHKIDDMRREADFVRFFEDADLVICDTMYSLAKTSTTKEHSGHSSNVVAIDLCRQAQAKRLALFHHDPLHDDDDIQQLHEDSIRYEELTRDGPALEVLCAYDGLDVTV